MVGATFCTNEGQIMGLAVPPQRDASPVQTDSLQYHLRKVPGAYDAYATATYVNRTGGPVYFARCGSAATGPLFYLRRSGPDSTAAAFIGAVWACVGGVPTGTLAPGEALSVRVWLGSTESPNANPPIRPSERVGRFRVEFALCAAPAADSDYCVPVPQAQRQSNAFDVLFENP
jgi:hypothetical protein